MKGVYRIITCAVAVLFALPASAQLQMIDQAKIDSIRNPRTVANMPMRFEEGTTLDMGQMSEDAEPWTREVKWKNHGTSPLVVTKVVTTCGCLKVDYDRWPVSADSVATLSLEYRPKGHPGTVYQRAMIYTNASESSPTAILVVKGDVLPVMNPVEDYPQTCGALRLRTKSVSFQRSGRQQIALACYNGGREPMRLSTDTLLTSPALRLESEPCELQPMEEGELIITFDPSKAIFISPEMPLYLRGIYLPPRERQLKVYIK